MYKKRDDNDWEIRFNKWKEARKKTTETNKVAVDLTDNENKIPDLNPVKILEKEVLELEKDIEEKLDLKHKPRLKAILTIFAYLIPIIILGAILFYIFQPTITGAETHYSVDVGVGGDDSSGKPLYLGNSRSLSPRVKYGEKTYREIIKTLPLSIFFKSTVSIPKNSWPVLSLDVTGTNSSLYINKELAFPNLKNYQIYKDFVDGLIFKKKGISEINYSEEENVEDFLIANYYGASIYSYLPFSNKPKIEGYKAEEMIINNTFRGNLNLLIYTEEDLQLNFIKQDLNWYLGADNYTVIVKNLNEEIIYQFNLSDDGNEGDDRLQREQYYNLTIPNLNGTFYLSFEQGVRGYDSTIKNIQINTNKVVFYRSFLVLNPIELYVKNYFPRDIEFYYWHSGKEQEVIINRKTYEIGKEYRGVIYPHHIEKEEYDLKFEKGDISINNGFFFSPKKENWFDFPLIVQKKISAPDFIVFDKTQIEFNEDGFKLYYSLPSEHEQEIQLRASNKYQFKLNEMGVEIV